ncbi:MAG: hypothetical protein WC352_01235 [Candidatus Omnitrophota bacterium]|jgi:hypothetical protein
MKNSSVFKSFQSFFLGIVFFSVVLCPQTSYAWTEYKGVRYLDLDGDSTNEIIIESKQGAGTGHYIEDMRIFKDKYPELQLIFQTRTVDEYFTDDYHYKIISEVEFSDSTLNSGLRDIIVVTKKIYFKDDENKVVSKEEDLGTKVLKWEGTAYLSPSEK